MISRPLCFSYSQCLQHKSVLIVGILYIYQVLFIASWQGFYFYFCVKMSGALYTEKVIKVISVISGPEKMRGVLRWVKQVAKLCKIRWHCMHTAVEKLRTMQRKHFSDFSQKKGKISNRVGWGARKRSPGNGYLGPKKNFLLLQSRDYGPVIILFVYRSSL